MQNRSPWISELDKNRKENILKSDTKTDVVVIGAGIAGIATCFFILENTNREVLLVDKYKLAHGATGHNAGHIVAYFEKSLSEIVKEFGMQLMIEAKKDLYSAWELFDHMYNKAGLSIPYTKMIGFDGYINKAQVLEALESIYLLKEGNLHFYKILIADLVDWVSSIDKKYEGIFDLISHDKILKNMESKDERYIACEPYNVGCANSALFCQGVLNYLLTKYQDRFSFFEHTPVNKVVLKKDEAILDAEKFTIEARRVVLCTNGFEHIEIYNKSGLDIDTKFHHEVHGVIGYMSAYVESSGKLPFAGCYFSTPDENPNNPYFYMTRRIYEYGGDPNASLVSVGGPQFYLESRKEYDRESEYPEDAKEEIDSFVKNTFGDITPKEEDEFNWHGLMGYTKNMIRLIGPEPKNSILMYNLGCNGIGILPSIFGGYKISKFLNGDDLPPSIFDPK